MAFTPQRSPHDSPHSIAHAQFGKTALRWLLAVVATFVLALVVAVVVITNWNWNSARPWVSERVAEATGRTFAIEGDLSAQWHWPQPLESGWRRWIPGVTVSAQNIVLGNPEGFEIEEAGEKKAADRPSGSNALPAVPARTSTERVEASLSMSRTARRPAAAGEPASQPASQPALPTQSASQADDVAQAASDAIDSEDNPKDRERSDAEQARRLLAKESASESDDGALEPPPRAPNTMGTVARASATLRLLPLLKRTIALDTVVLTAPDIVLGRTKDGINNWTFNRAEKAAGPAWNLSLGQLIVRRGWLGYADGVKDLALRARVDTFDPAQRDDEEHGKNSDEDESDAGLYGVRVTLFGHYGKARIEGQGVAGPILSLRNTVVNYPLHFKARAGTLRAEAEGILANPRELSGMDLQVSLQGGSMADLYDLTGLVLPNTPPFKTRGRLLGSLGADKAVWEYRDFDGVVGASDIHGSLTYTSAKPRPRLEGRMLSKKLRLVDLGPLIGGTPTQEASLRKKGRVLPETAFKTGRWSAMDLDIAFTGEKIIRPASLPLENLSTRAVLKDAELTLSPLRFGVARGKIDATLVLDSREKPLRAKLHGNAQGMQLGALFPKVELMRKSFGRLDGGFSLETRGDSVASMLGRSSGDIKLYIRDGTLSKEMLDLAALNIGSVVVTKLFGADKEVELRCAVVDLSVRDGLASLRTAKLSTPEAIVEATGVVNLADETIDVRVKPESLKWKFFSLRTPLNVKGTFADPKVGVESGPLLLRAGAAVAAAVVAPVALALVPITVPGAQDDADCKSLLAKAK